jgi:Lysozyme like domain
MAVVLSASQIAEYASAAGFSGDDLVTAVAVALAESGGDPNAHGDTDLGSGTGSFGLWQIYSDAHPEYKPFTQLYDPRRNANAAYAIYKEAGSSFTPWSTYNGGEYEEYLDNAQQGVNAISAGPDSV